MSRRRRASEIIFNKSRALKYPVDVHWVTSGTGTVTQGGVITLVASGSVATSAYVVRSNGTNIGTLIGSAGTVIH